MKNETAKSADYKIVKYRDPNTGKLKFRKVRHNDKIVKQQDVEEKAVSKAQQKFFGMVRAKQKGEMPDASPEVKKAADSMSKKDVKDFAATKHKGLPAKKEATDAEVKKKQDFLDRLRGKPPVKETMSDKAGPGKGKDMRDMSKLDHAKARDYHQYKIKKKGDYHYKMSKIHHRNAIGGSSMMHKEEKTYFDFISELTAKQRAEIEKRKAARMKTRGARRGPAKGTKTNDAAQQAKAKAKPLGFEVKKTDHHSSVHKTIAKAADAMHPSLGSDARHVALKIDGKTKVYKNHKDLQHVVDYHSKLRDKSQKADLMRSVRSGGHDAISKHTGVYRKVTKQ